MFHLTIRSWTSSGNFTSNSYMLVFIHNVNHRKHFYGFTVHIGNKLTFIFIFAMCD